MFNKISRSFKCKKGQLKMANPQASKKKNGIMKRFPFGWIFAFIIFILLINSFNLPINGVPKEITYSSFYKILKDDPAQIKFLTKTETILQGDFTNGSKFFVNIHEKL